MMQTGVDSLERVDAPIVLLRACRNPAEFHELRIPLADAPTQGRPFACRHDGSIERFTMGIR